MTTTVEHPALAPVTLSGLALRNRYAVAPMSRVSARPDGTPTGEMADYYAEFARGGFGLVFSEGTYPDSAASQGYLNQPGLARDEHVAGWRVVTAGVRAAGGRMIAQLMHAGAIAQGNPDTVGPSAVQPRGEKMRAYGGSGPWPVPRELTTAEIDDIIDGFAAAAVRARQAGFDGVEVHAANGYLLDQFLTDYTNHRTDSHGGPVANRIRLTARVVTAVAEAVPELVTGVRLSQTKVNDFTYRWPGGRADAEVIFAAVAEAGAQYLHIASEGRNWLETAKLADGGTITALAREVTGLPVIANGGMHDLAQAHEVLTGGHADLLSIGHGALANPDLPARVAAAEPLAEFDRAMVSPTVTVANARRWRESRQA
ncbi:oxidoreductase [Amycolatopsis keratiniphila]|uniref:NADH:flavin oxidoreductase n=1 Tax=Amycolatopsis keratiniphila subsp. keratiniphila TaxID=227715 RepID=A0A1W2LWB1_9PSEU|nr:NADH:flavin oxidoreductase [Amycolatopsis keratiniphila]ONF70826.1 NADH:flavin oxidoreductase [Amycolatopsis keratiniphila subsp. keratiniphila]